jgi:hypothetical protein
VELIERREGGRDSRRGMSLGSGIDVGLYILLSLYGLAMQDGSVI